MPVGFKVCLEVEARETKRNMLLEKIEQLLKEVNELKASNAEEIEALRVKYLSKKCEISALMNDFPNVAAD